MDDFSKMEDKELYDRIETGIVADNFIYSENGRLIREAAKRIVEKTITNFALKTDPNDLAAVIEAKIVIRKYKFGLFEEIKYLSEDGDKASDELKERHENLGSETGIDHES